MALLAAFAVEGSLEAAGIPEPSLVIYGVVSNLASGGSRVSFGALSWVFQPTLGGAAITVTATLTNINDQFSYVLRVPCETAISGVPVSPGALKLATAYNRAAVTIEGMAASFSQPAQTNLVLLGTDRGRIERVDLLVDLPAETFAQWLARYGFPPGTDPNLDPLHKGMTLYEEFIAGTDPRNPQSLFAFVSVSSHPLGGVGVEWSSVQGRLYTLQRSGDLLTGFADVQTHISATAPLNAFRDAAATGAGPYFYRLRVEP
jgi:hypothetical protein